MSAVEPLFSQQAATDVLKNLFTPPAEQSSGNNKESHSDKSGGSSTISNRETASSKEPENKATEASEACEEQEMPQAEAKEISPGSGDNVQIDHFITQSEQSDDNEHVTKADLVRVLETFVTAIKETQEKQNVHANLPSPLNFDPANHEVMAELLSVKNAEIDELKNLLVEAQGTIITLLTDRVDDKAKIATMESQLRYLPDYQRLHTPPSPVPAVDSDELRADLTKVKAELQNIKNTAFKTNLDNAPKWQGIKGWLAKFVSSKES
ncbi:MAG TPA: hypothetical protein V6C97_07410 [Oculatellaceae cyanobacterium]